MPRADIHATQGMHQSKISTNHIFEPTQGNKCFPIGTYRATDLWHVSLITSNYLSTFSFAKEVKQYLLFKQYSYGLRKNIFKSISSICIINWVTRG